MSPKEILVATTNRGKIEEIKKILAGDFPNLRVYSLEDLGIDRDCPETGQTFMENAVEKSRFYCDLAGGMFTLADDSGLAVEALKGEPGIHSARYSGPGADDRKNIEKLLQALAGEKERAAKFVCTAALSKNGEIIAGFTGEVKGIILEEKRGDGGFGYDPVFYYPPLKKTFAELSTGQKNGISHRAAALRKFKAFLQGLG